MTPDVTVEEILRAEIPDRPLRRPVMVIALGGWFDAGDTATLAADELIPPETAVTVAEIDPDPLFDFTQQRPRVTRAAGGTEIRWPTNQFRVTRTGTDHDLVVLSGVEPHLHWRTFAAAVVEVARRTSCELVVTLGAHPDAVPHTRPSIVVGSTTDPALARRWGLAEPQHQGITGVVGVLQSALDEAEIPAISLRVGVPHYLEEMLHPAASQALLIHLFHVIETELPTRLDDALTEAELLNAERMEADAQLREYVHTLEASYDQRAEAAMPRQDELLRGLHEILGDAGSDPPPDEPHGP